MKPRTWSLQARFRVAVLLVLACMLVFAGAMWIGERRSQQDLA